METITKTTVDARIGKHDYRAEVDGISVALFRDGASLGAASWCGGRIVGFPEALGRDAADVLTAGIAHNLAKAWRARTDRLGEGESLAGSAPVHVEAPADEDEGGF